MVFLSHALNIVTYLGTDIPRDFPSAASLVMFRITRYSTYSINIANNGIMHTHIISDKHNNINIGSCIQN